MKAINSENIQEVLQGNVAVLDFWATWCGPCRMLSPTVEELSEIYGEKVNFGAVNVDDAEDVAIKYGISVIPTLIFLKNGEIVKKTIGVKKKEELESIIKECLGE